MPLPIGAAAPLGRRLQAHQLREVLLRLVAVGEPQEVLAVGGVLPRAVARLDRHPAVVAESLLHDAVKGPGERRVVVSRDDDDVGRRRLGGSLDQPEERVAPHLQHLLEPAVPLQRRAAGRRAGGGVVMEEVAAHRDRSTRRGVLVARLDQFVAGLLHRRLGDGEVVVVGAGFLPGVFAEVRIGDDEDLPEVGRLPLLELHRRAPHRPRGGGDHRLDALADAGAGFLLQPNPDAVERYLSLAAGRFPDGRLARRHLELGQVGLDVPQEVVHGLDAVRDRGDLLLVAVGLLGERRRAEDVGALGDQFFSQS